MPPVVNDVVEVIAIAVIFPQPTILCYSSSCIVVSQTAVAAS
jgi:hypothetical protein